MPMLEQNSQSRLFNQFLCFSRTQKNTRKVPEVCRMVPALGDLAHWIQNSGSWIHAPRSWIHALGCRIQIHALYYTGQL